MSKTWFITGTSTGLGRGLTEQLLARGDRVAATLRTPARLDDLAEQHGDRLWRRQLDVTDVAQMRTVVREAFDELGRIDVVVSNAGFGIYGAVEELRDDEIDALIATNLVGSIQLARAVAPHLRAQGSGHLLQLSSMGGIVAFPGFALYHVTKWGMEGFYDAFAREVAPFGIRTTLVEPGITDTPFYDGVPTTPVMDAYADHPDLVREVGVAAEDMPSDAGKVVRAMIEVVEEDDPPHRLLLGSDTFEHATAAWRERLAAAEAQRERAYGVAQDRAEA